MNKMPDIQDALMVIQFLMIWINLKSLLKKIKNLRD